MQIGSYPSLAVAEREAAPALALVLTCCPVRVWDARGPGRSADSCQAVSDSRASALPGLRHRVPVIRFFLTSRNCRAGPLEYHMAFSTCRRLVSISLAGPTWLPLRTSPSCPSASSPAVSRLLPTLARPSSPRPTSFFLLRAQRRAPDYISRQAPRPVANRAPRIWRRRRRTGRGGFVRGGGGGGSGGDGGGSWRRGDPDGGRGWGRVPGAWERCAAFDWNPGTPLPFGAASLRLLSGTSSYAATPVRPPPLRSASPATFRLPANEPGRPGRGPPECRPPWQGCSAPGKSSPRISCGLARFRLLRPRSRQLPATQPHFGPPCLSCDRTDTAGGLEWNKLKVKCLCMCVLRVRAEEDPWAGGDLRPRHP